MKVKRRYDIQAWSSPDIFFTDLRVFESSARVSEYQFARESRQVVFTRSPIKSSWRSRKLSYHSRRIRPYRIRKRAPVFSFGSLRVGDSLALMAEK